MSRKIIFTTILVCVIGVGLFVSSEWLDAVNQSEGFKIAQNIKTSDFEIRCEDI